MYAHLLCIILAHTAPCIYGLPLIVDGVDADLRAVLPGVVQGVVVDAVVDENHAGGEVVGLAEHSGAARQGVHHHDLHLQVQNSTVQCSTVQ